MKWYTLFCGEDFSDHSVGFLNEDFNADDFSASNLIAHAKEIAGSKAWLVITVTFIDPGTHELIVSKLFEHWAPLKKKIILDPKKGKVKNKTESLGHSLNTWTTQTLSLLDVHVDTPAAEDL